jgi:hypothetical protein
MHSDGTPRFWFSSGGYVDNTAKETRCESDIRDKTSFARAASLFAWSRDCATHGHELDVEKPLTGAPNR